MASVEIIGLLCAGSTRYHEPGGHGSARDKLSRAELAGLLSGLDRVAMNLALAKYAGDLEAERMLIAQMRVWADGMAVHESWHIVKSRPTLSNMMALAVFEVVRPNRCPYCKGRGILKVKVCSGCGGSTFKSLSNRYIAEASGIAESTYRAIWKERYERLYSHVRNIDSDVNNLLKLRHI